VRKREYGMEVGNEWIPSPADRKQKHPKRSPKTTHLNTHPLPGRSRQCQWETASGFLNGGIERDEEVFGWREEGMYIDVK